MEKFIYGLIFGIIITLFINALLEKAPERLTERQVLNQVVQTFNCDGYDQRGICKSTIGHLNYLNENEID